MALLTEPDKTEEGSIKSLEVKYFSPLPFEWIGLVSCQKLPQFHTATKFRLKANLDEMEFKKSGEPTSR